MREGEEIEGRKPSWFTGKIHHTLSTIKSSHALRSVQELASNRPMLLLIGKPTKKPFTPEHCRKSNDISEFLLCHIPELTSHDTNRLSHILVLRLQADEPNNDRFLRFPSFDFVKLISYSQHIYLEWTQAKSSLAWRRLPQSLLIVSYLLKRWLNYTLIFIRMFNFWDEAECS